MPPRIAEGRAAYGSTHEQDSPCAFAGASGSRATALADTTSVRAARRSTPPRADLAASASTSAVGSLTARFRPAARDPSIGPPLRPGRKRRRWTLSASQERLGEPSWQTVLVDDEELLAQAEQALTEIKVAQGLSDRHSSVLAALRIRLRGSAGKSLEELLEAAGDLRPDSLEEKLAEAELERKPSLDDLLTKEPKPKRDWPS